MSTGPLADKLNEARKELLDLGLRNTLINYRVLRSRGVEIIDELPEEVFRILVQQGKVMSFLQAPESDIEQTETDRVEDLFARFDQPEEEEEGIAARHFDTKLQTPHTSARLQRRLLNTYYAARTFMEEQGVNVLYLALGMLEWRESPSSETTRRAPLILVPVELTRTSAQAKFRVHYTGDDIGDNLSLHAKLKAEFGITLPSIATTEELDLPAYFDEVTHAINGFPHWSVDRTAIALGFFSFGKFLMYNDLDLSQWPEDASPEKHPVVQALLGDGFGEPATRIDDEAHLDKYLHPEQVHHVMDADGSQTLAILDVKQGLNLVIQGPPGTGKSQTITNLIAEAIGQGKTVLFVSEKMAALEVVKRRLDAIDLGVACLELHSHKTRKKALLEELEHTLRLGRPKTDAFEQDLSVLLDARQQLNVYCEAVNTPIGASGVRPYRAYGELVRLQQQDEIDLPIIDTPSLRQWTGEKFRQREALVEQMQSLIGSMGVPSEHPFWGSRRMVFLPTEKPQIVKAVTNVRDACRALQKSSRMLAEDLGIKDPFAPRDASILCRAARRAMQAPNLAGVTIETRTWRAQSGPLAALIDAGARFEALHAAYDDLLIPEAWDQTLLDVRQHLTTYGEKWWRFLIGDFRRAKNRLAGLCQKPLPKAAEERLSIVNAIMEAQRKQAEIESHASLGEELFGVQWQKEHSDWDVLRRIAEWIQELYTEIEGGHLPRGLLAFLSGDPDLDRLTPLVAVVEKALSIHAEKAKALVESLAFDAGRLFGEGQTLAGQPFETQQTMMQRCIDEVDRLQEMVAFNHRADEMEKEDLGLLLDFAITWPHAGSHFVDALRFNWLNGLVVRAMEEHPVLAQFDGATHDQVVEKFKTLDNLSLAYNRARLALAHWKSLPRHGAAGQVGVLRQQFQRKRRHLPIRKLIEQAGNAIQAIKPVFMMSPMSIATYLPPGSLTFDLVVFDEASQVKPVDAFGAILRGSQVVVVGDSKQLPPTSFFDSMFGGDDDADTTTADMESILGLFNAQGAPERMLRWHYRSRHESLITVSNREFYNGRLVTFPSPDAARRELGLKYHHLPNTHYDRGGRRTNREEAEIVARAVMDHACNRSHWTLGVATFSTAQMQEVLDQIEILRRQDPTCEAFFNSHEDEPFFVKNLENVQGDERDVIFISIGYGRDANGHVTMNFGPLNKDGGERRLNVLITRARRRCEVFTNLRAEDIDLNRTQARGVEALKRYLQYAATGELEMAVPTGGDAESPFEQAVADALRDQGFRVVHQVGSAGFRIDLAIVDEDQPGHYLLGIECDGATYHSARTARDRDRIRQSVLEGLGWQIHRIWSTDWFRNPKRELKKVAEAVERAKVRSGASRSTSPRVTTERLHLEREQHPETAPDHPAAVPYKAATINIQPYFRQYDLHEVPASTLAQWIQHIVTVESPIHLNEAARRIMEAFGVSRMGRRIREAMEGATDYARRRGWLKRQGNFLFCLTQTEIVIRDRSSLSSSSRKLELIAPLEIAAAIEQVVSVSYGIAADDVPLEVSRLFGFAQTSENMRQQISFVLNDLRARGRVAERGGHLIVNQQVSGPRPS